MLFSCPAPQRAPLRVHTDAVLPAAVADHREVEAPDLFSPQTAFYTRLDFSCLRPDPGTVASMSCPSTPSVISRVPFTLVPAWMAPPHPARSSVRAHKERVEKILAENLKSITTEAEALELAEHFSFLLEGAVARSGLEGTPSLEHARAIASRIPAAL